MFPFPYLCGGWSDFNLDKVQTAEEEKTMRDCLQIMEVDNSTTVEGLRRLTIENGRCITLIFGHAL